MLSAVMRHIGYRQFDGVTLSVDDGPERFRGLGWVVHVTLYAGGPYRARAAHLVLPDDLDAAERHLAEATARLEPPGAAAAALDRPLAETLGLAEAVFEPSMFDPDPLDVHCRTEALATMRELFPAVAQRFHRVYGLRLPRHLAVFAAFWDSLAARERHLMTEHLGLRPWGVHDYFRPDGATLTGRDGLDERLHCRFRRDPAEFVTVLGGDSDGLHYGLWYDDPAELPSFVVHNYARDSAETWTSQAPTVLAQVRHRLRRALDDAEDDTVQWRLYPLTRALDWFADADSAALAEDGVRRWADAPRPPGGISIGAALPPGSGDPRAEQAYQRLDAYRDDPAAARRWIDDATAELADGRPALALAVGAELHWLDADEYRQQALDLLVGAYRALGRDALADLAQVHFTHRDLPSVDVLTAG